MAYSLGVEKGLEKQLGKLSRSDKALYIQLLHKIQTLCENPGIGKPLRGKYKNVRRVHIGSFVLKYKIEDVTRTLTLLTFEHHDDAYK